MKKLFLTFTCILLCFFAKAALTYNYYYPDGKKLDKEFNTIEEVQDFLGENVNFTVINDDVVFYPNLSNTILLICTKKKITPALIASLQKEHEKYYESIAYRVDLKDLTNAKKLTKAFLLKAFGKPSNSDYLESISWEYYLKNLCVYHSDDIVYAFIVKNFLLASKVKFGIEEYRITGSRNTIGFKMKVLNYSNKTIKYIYFNTTIYNPVNDKLGNKTLKGIGPIESMESANYEFEDIMYSSVASNIQFNSIKIQYMDGTILIIPKQQISKLLPYTYDYYNQD